MKRLRISRKLGIIIMLSKYLPPYTTLYGGDIIQYRSGGHKKLWSWFITSTARQSSSE